MRKLHRQGQRPKVQPAAQNRKQRKSGCLKWPQNASIDAEMHQARQKVQARQKMAQLFQQYMAQLNSNEHGVTVTSEPVPTEEKICLSVYKNKEVVPLTVKNSGAKPVYLTFWAPALVKNIFTVRGCHGNIIKTIKKHMLGPGETYKIMVQFNCDHAGFYEQLLVFKFETLQQSAEKFEIMRLLEVIHQTSVNEELRHTTKHPQSVRSTSTSTTTTTSTRVLMWLHPVVPLEDYQMPDSVKNTRKCRADLQKPLNWKNYSKRFHLLLHLEELKQKTEVEKYIQDDVPMFKHGGTDTDLFMLQTTEKVSIKIPGYQVLVTSSDRSIALESRTYKGWVNHVMGERVFLKLNEKFLSHFKEGMRFTVKFTLNRIPLRLQHRAVSLAHKHGLKELLFPTEQLSSHHSHLHRLSEVEKNPEQYLAIQHIVAGSAKPAPYLVFGPPGTGKTMTLVEAIKQIVKTQSSCNILVCAPSNTATDHLCEKLIEGKIRRDQVYRLYALNSIKNIPQNIKFCCNLDSKTNTVMFPPKSELMKYKIMVTTLLTAGRLVTGGIPKGHYSYLFVDEAGQAGETECIIPIAGLLTPQRCQVVLAGDPKQLGPIIISTIAKSYGLNVSLLERLMRDINLYKSHQTDGFNNRFVTKLLRNYRSHPAILKIPNELFYEGELQPYANAEKCNLYSTWECLPKKGFPLIFHGVAGTHELDSDSPSVYNMAEVEVLKEYLKALVHHHKKDRTRIKPGEIGIITPYRKQVQKIQNALQMDKDLRKENLENILIGSVEQFQGKEFNVILMSAVRSNPKLTAHKQHFTLGFVDDEKRFNVAMTRAQALLIVIGDPRVLKADQIWNRFIHYCFKEGAYRGITVSEEEEEDTSMYTQQTSEERDSATARLEGEMDFTRSS